MYVRSIKIENLRCFKTAELHLQYPGRSDAAAPKLRNINLLLGTNGAGKTTALKALALATLAPVITQAGYVPYHLIRSTGPRDEKSKEARVSAEVVLHDQDLDGAGAASMLPQTLTTQVVRTGDTEMLMSQDAAASFSATSVWHNMFFDASPAFLVVGYGATRRVQDTGAIDVVAQSKSRLLRYQRVAGLFEGQVALRPLASWLPDFKEKNKGRYTQVVHLIDRLLPEGASFSGLYDRGEFHFKLGRNHIPFGALSDGYRAYIGWVADLLYHVCMGAPKGAKLVDNRGLVLVDEIDLHLHPEWQRTIVSKVSETLPNLQFVFTTHSPIVAGSLHKENIIVMESVAPGVSEARKYEERIYGLDAEQVLLSSYFNLKSTRAPGFVDELRELSRQASEDDPSKALEIMQKLSGQPSDDGQSDDGAGSSGARAAAGKAAVSSMRKKKPTKKPAGKSTKSRARKALSR